MSSIRKTNLELPDPSSSLRTSTFKTIRRKREKTRSQRNTVTLGGGDEKIEKTEKAGSKTLMHFTYYTTARGGEVGRGYRRPGKVTYLIEIYWGKQPSRGC